MKVKKIMSILGGSLLLGATFGGIAFAAENLISSYSPSSLTAISSPSIIYGQNAAQTDNTGATNILNIFNGSSISNVNETYISGEVKAIETSSQPLYLGDIMNDTKATFTKDQLPTVLEDGTISDSDGKDYDYNLRINTPNSAVIYGAGPDNLDPPIIYADFDSNTQYDLRIVFPTAVDPSKLYGEQISLFGKTYTFSSNSNDLTNTSIIVFENSQSLRINDGGSITNNGHTYTASVEDTTHAIVYVDGESKTVKEGFSGKIHGVDIYVRDIFGPDYISSGQQRYVEIYVNANSLKLEDGQEVQRSGDSIAGTNVDFISSGSKVSEIRVSVIPSQLDDEISYIKEGISFIDPVFKSLKFTLQGVNPSLTNTSRDYIEIGASREDRIGLTFTNKLNKEYDLSILKPGTVMLDAGYNPMYSSTCTTYDVGTSTCLVAGTYTYNSVILGMDGTKSIIVETNKEIKEGDYFVTTSGEDSQIWKVDNIRSDGRIDVRDAMGGDTTTLSMGSIGSTASLSLADGSSATIKWVNATSLILLDKASNYLYTYRGAKIILPKDDSGMIQIVEDTPYNGGEFHSNSGIMLGNTLTLNWSYKSGRSGKDVFLRNTNYGTKDTNYWTGDVGDNDVYSVTKYGTFIKQTGSDDKLIKMYYPENAMKASFYIGEINSVTQTTTTTGNNSAAILKDSDSSNYQEDNIIVVGGSCINAVAAALLGEERPLCGAEFTAKTGVTAGHYLIQAFKNPWNQDKVAVLVAGYNAEDTTRAVNDILATPMNLTVGSKIIG